MVEYVAGGGGPTLVRVSCDTCSRSCVSDVLMDDELCAAVSWTFDFGAVRCLLCQLARGETPAVAGRLTDASA